MGVYLLGRKIRENSDDMEYWTGEVNERGMPRTTEWKGGARHFTGARAAYEAAGTHDALKHSSHWKAVPR